jgi:hypothetical protein
MYIFQQDGATSRTSKVILDEEVPEFIKKTSVRRSHPIAILWIIMCIMGLTRSQRRFIGSRRTEKFTKEELKQRITECWVEISLAELRKSIGSWKKILRAVCGEDGGPLIILNILVIIF